MFQSARIGDLEPEERGIVVLSASCFARSISSSRLFRFFSPSEDGRLSPHDKSFPAATTLHSFTFCIFEMRKGEILLIMGT